MYSGVGAAGGAGPGLLTLPPDILSPLPIWDTPSPSKAALLLLLSGPELPLAADQAELQGSSRTATQRSCGGVGGSGWESPIPTQTPLW